MLNSIFFDVRLSTNLNGLKLKTPVPIRGKNTNGKNFLLILVFKGTKEDMKEKSENDTNTFTSIMSKEHFCVCTQRVDARMEQNLAIIIFTGFQDIFHPFKRPEKVKKIHR